jgi:2-succinyl-5-enolpyruvyl-6-hydroxy-3-cyclohexene-1-carboxylate synthase
MSNVQATFAATLVDEWVRCGVEHAVIAPGSRSTPLALALWASDDLDVSVHHDERAAAFMALGIGKASGRPAILLCTSGTAAAELHPAVVEAHQARVPMIVCTADRPPELQSVGAPQTIDQTHLYGRAVRWFAEPGVAEDATRHTWRPLAARAHDEATGRVPGPVHLNLAFRDPLVATPHDLPMANSWWLSAPDAVNHHEFAAGRGVVVAGGGAMIANEGAWPVLADPSSGLRVPGAIGAFDALLRTGTMPVPEMVVRVGDAPASKVLAQWLAGLDVPQYAVGSVLVDPDRTASFLGDVVPVLKGGDPTWLQTWRDAESAAQRAIDDVLAHHVEVTEPYVARTIAAHATTLVVSSSMPVRDLEWYGAPRDGLRVLANRGANGIDGVVSTAVGVALATDAHVTVLVGDVAFLHDTNALLGLASRELDMTIVVVDNRGGGIFSFLPQASELGADTFEPLFGTPHDVDLIALARAHGIDGEQIEKASDLEAALASRSGVRVVVAPTDRQRNVVVHDEVHAAVAEAVARL